MLVLKDERSNLDIKTRQCVYIGYGRDDLGHKFYDPVAKKLVRIHHMVFFKAHTIKDIEMVENVNYQSPDYVVDPDPVPMTRATNPIVNGDRNYLHDDSQSQNDK